MQGHNVNCTIDPGIPSLLQWSCKWKYPSFEQILGRITCFPSMATQKPTQATSVCLRKGPSLHSQNQENFKNHNSLM